MDPVVGGVRAGTADVRAGAAALSGIGAADQKVHQSQRQQAQAQPQTALPSVRWPDPHDRACMLVLGPADAVGGCWQGRAVHKPTSRLQRFAMHRKLHQCSNACGKAGQGERSNSCQSVSCSLSTLERIATPNVREVWTTSVLIPECLAERLRRAIAKSGLQRFGPDSD